VSPSALHPFLQKTLPGTIEDKKKTRQKTKEYRTLVNLDQWIKSKLQESRSDGTDMGSASGWRTSWCSSSRTGASTRRRTSIPPWLGRQFRSARPDDGGTAAAGMLRAAPVRAKAKGRGGETEVERKRRRRRGGGFVVGWERIGGPVNFSGRSLDNSRIKYRVYLWMFWMVAVVGTLFASLCTFQKRERD
jgi:hypothetical protein